MSNIQEQFNSFTNSDFTLSPGEYEGPLVVNRPCTIDGKKSTLWSNNGPVLLVLTPDVTIKNLRIEVTGNSEKKEDRIAIKTDASNTKLENVEVNGNVIGLSGESESWNLPSVICLGEFASGKKNTFSFNIQASGKAVIESRVKNLSIYPNQLCVGQNNLILTTDEMGNNTVLYGEIMVHTSVMRRIYVMGKALNNAPVHNEKLPTGSIPTVSLPVQIDIPNDIIAPQVSDTEVKNIKKGQRIYVREMNSTLIKIIYEHQSAEPGIDIDNYSFKLMENGKVSCDEDLIFFGNPAAADQSVKLSNADGKPLLLIELKKIPASVSKIAVCYSIYGDDTRQNFSKVSSPIIRIFGGDRELFRFALDDLSEEKTVVALEIYRYKGEWKMNFIGAGYKSGLRQLCEGYGVDVE